MPSPTDIEELDAIDPRVVRLAMCVSLAVRVDPPLLREMRLALIPDCDTSVEADLWFDDRLVESRGIDGFAFASGALAWLRQQLEAEPDLLERAWNITRRQHANLSPELLIEEQVTYAALCGDDAAIERGLAAAAENLADEDIQFWASHALPRMPARVKQKSGSAWKLHFASQHHFAFTGGLDANLPTEILRSANLEEAVSSLGKTFLLLRRDGDRIVFGDVSLEAGTVRIPVPQTDPLQVEISWGTGSGRLREQVVEVGEGEQVQRRVGFGALKIRTLAGETFGLEALPQEAEAPDAGPPESVAPLSGRRRALCVGIDHYEDFPLSGAVNDAHIWHGALQGLGFETTVLTDEKATREGIVSALQNLISSSRGGDSLVFQFSGYGTRVPDLNGDEEDGMDEAFVPFDYQSGNFLIDDDLAALIESLPDGVRVTAFFDCSYSGTLTRMIPRVPSPDIERPRFLRLPSSLIQAYQGSRLEQNLVSPSGSGSTRRRDGWLAFYASRPEQTAKEIRGQGNFTRAAVAGLAKAAGQHSNAEFLGLVIASLPDSANQTPTLDSEEGVRDDPFLFAPSDDEKDLPGITTAVGHAGPVWDVAVTADGKTIASASTDGTVRVWNAANGHCQMTLEGHEDAVFSVAISPDGRLLASGSRDGSARVYDLQSGELISTAKAFGPVYSVAWIGADSTAIAVGDGAGTVQIVKAQTGEQLEKLEFESAVFQTATSGEQEALHVALADGSLRWQYPDNESQLAARHEGPVCCFAIVPERELIVSGGYYGILRVGIGETDASHLDGHRETVWRLSVSPDGTMLASASWDGTVRLWDLESRRLLHTLEFTEPVSAVAFSPDGERLVVGCDDARVYIYDEFLPIAEAGIDALPEGGKVLLDLRARDRLRAIQIAADLTELGFSVYCQPDTAVLLKQLGIRSQRIDHPAELIAKQEISLVIQTLGENPSREQADIHEAAEREGIPLISDIRAAQVSLQGIRSRRTDLPPPDEGRRDPGFLLILSAEKDVAAAGEVGSDLAEQSGLAYEISHDVPDLTNYDGVVIVHDNNSENWLDETLQRCAKAHTNIDEPPLAIYLRRELSDPLRYGQSPAFQLINAGDEQRTFEFLTRVIGTSRSRSSES